MILSFTTAAMPLAYFACCRASALSVLAAGLGLGAAVALAAGASCADATALPPSMAVKNKIANRGVMSRGFPAVVKMQ